MKKSNSFEVILSLPDLEYSRVHLSKYYLNIQSNPELVSQENILKRNVFHNIAICINDEPKKEQEKLMSDCLQFVFGKIQKGYNSIINHRDNLGNTPMDYAIEHNNLYFFKILITQNIVDPWDAIKDKVISKGIQLLLLEHYFDLKLDKLSLSPKEQALIIDKMEEKHVFFVLNMFDSLDLDLEEREEIITKKVISYNNPELVSKLIIYEIGIEYLEKSPNDMVYILTLAIDADCSDRVIKILLDYTEQFTLTQYNQLMTWAIELSIYWDTEGNTIFHKLASISEKNREDNFGQLMYDTLKMILNYLDCHERNKIKEEDAIRYKEIVYYVGTFNKTALEWAIESNQLDFVSALMKLNALENEAFAGLKYADSNKMKQLIYEFRLSQLGITLEQIQDFKTKDQAASIMIEMVSEKSLAVTSDLFMQYNISLDFQSFSHKPERKIAAAGNTLLHKAVVYENIDIVNKLIELGVNLNLQNKEGFTPIAIATSINNDKIIDILLNAKADVNLCSIKGTSPLHFAVINLNHVLVETLKDIEYIDVSKQDANGNTPMHFALSSQYWCNLNSKSKNIYTWFASPIKIINFLFKAKADINMANKNGDTPIHCVVREAKRSDENFHLISSLLKLPGLNINKGDADENTVMHISAMNGNLNILKLLYEYGGRIDVINKKGFKPLDLVNEQSEELVKYLIELGVDNVRENCSKNEVISCIINSIEQADLIFSEDNSAKGISITDNHIVFIRLKHLLKSTDLEKAKIENLYNFLQLIKFDQKLIYKLFSDHYYTSDYKGEEDELISEEIIYNSINDEIAQFQDKELEEEILEKQEDNYEEVSLFSDNSGNQTSEDL